MTPGPGVRVGVDVGGTKIRIGILDDSGAVLAGTRLPTRSTEGAHANAMVVLDGLEALLDRHRRTMSQVSFIGVGVPGTVDTSTGLVEYCPNLPWLDEPLGALLGEATSAPVLVAQDSRCAAWGELLFGVGGELADFLMVTVGTGIGSGVILDGKILSGAMNTAGELGHSILQRNGKPCSCGNRGCLERYASGNAIGEIGGEAFPDEFVGRPTAERVFELAARGFGPAQHVISDAVDSLAQSIVNAVDLLSVSGVVISGGLCVHEELFVEPLRRSIEDMAYFPWKRKGRLRVIPAQLGSDAPMIGAGFLDRAYENLLPPVTPDRAGHLPINRLEPA